MDKKEAGMFAFVVGADEDDGQLISGKKNMLSKEPPPASTTTTNGNANGRAFWVTLGSPSTDA